MCTVKKSVLIYLPDYGTIKSKFKISFGANSLLPTKKMMFCFWWTTHGTYASK